MGDWTSVCVQVSQSTGQCAIGIGLESQGRVPYEMCQAGCDPRCTPWNHLNLDQELQDPSLNQP